MMTDLTEEPKYKADWLKVLNPHIKLTGIEHALFDFDGTLSTLRQGWEGIMVPLMIEMICDGNEPSKNIINEVEEYVDRSTGILTIEQMKWLEEAVIRHSMCKNPLTAKEYKRIYIERLLVPVQARLKTLNKGSKSIKDFVIAGGIEFLKGLREKGIKLYLASGTDHQYVMEEAGALGFIEFFEDRIYGALDDSEAHAKEKVIRRILSQNDLSGRALLVVGDGPVEIREAKAHGAVTIGVASDEIKRQGLNPRKEKRLTMAGADIIIPDFNEYQELLNIIQR